MAKKIMIENPDLGYEESSYLSSDYASGTSITVKNNAGFTAQYFVVVGEPTQEQTECKDISSLSGTTGITLSSALNFSHPKSSPVYESQWDKIAVERSSGGAYSTITNSPFLIDWDSDDNSTLIYDGAGSDSSTYRWRFFNSVTGTYSEYSGLLPGEGLSRDQAGFIIKKVRRNKQLTEGVEDEAMFEYMTDFNDMIYEQMPEAWWFQKEGAEVSTTADSYKFDIYANWPDLLSIDLVLYHYVNGSTDETYPIEYMSMVEFYNFKRDANQSTDDYVTNWSLLPKDSTATKGYIGLHSTPKTDDCGLIPVCFVQPDPIDDYADTLPIPKPKAYEDYVLFRIADDIKNDGDSADKYEAKINADILALKKRSKRQFGQKEFLKYRGQKGFARMFNGISSYYRPNRVDYW